MLRKAALLVLVLAAALAVANLVMLLRAQARGSLAARSAWHVLSPAEQNAALALYREVQRMPDSAAVLRAARSFAQMPPARQDCLRLLAGRLHAVLDRQSPAQRRSLLLTTPSARAWFVYDWLRQNEPAELAALAARLERCGLGAGAGPTSAARGARAK